MCYLHLQAKKIKLEKEVADPVYYQYKREFDGKFDEQMDVSMIDDIKTEERELEPKQGGTGDLKEEIPEEFDDSKKLLDENLLDQPLGDLLPDLPESGDEVASDFSNDPLDTTMMPVSTIPEKVSQIVICII